MLTLNPMCDGGKCQDSSGVVHVLPLGEHGNAILCHVCFNHEIAWRRRENKRLSLSLQWDIPRWDDLETYNGAE